MTSRQGITRTLSIVAPPGGSQDGKRSARVDQPFIEGAAADRAFEDGAVRAAEPLDVGERGEAATGDHRHRSCTGNLEGRLDVETLEDAVAGDVGVDDRGNAESGLALCQLDGRKRQRAGPALDRDRTVARVDTDCDTTGKGPAGLAHEIGIARGSRAENDPGDARLEPAAKGCKVANAAAELDRDGDRRQDCGNGVAVDRPARYGAVEIDDVEPGEALVGEGLGRDFGHLRVNGRSSHLAALEADAAAILEVYGGEQDHGRQRRKFASSPSPKAWLFSGWNWVPARLSRSTMAVTAPP